MAANAAATIIFRWKKPKMEKFWAARPTMRTKRTDTDDNDIVSMTLSDLDDDEIEEIDLSNE